MLKVIKIAQPNNLILFYNELNLFLFNTYLYGFKTKMCTNQLLVHSTHFIEIKNKYLINNNKTTNKYFLNLLTFYLKTSYFGTAIRFRINGRGYRLFNETNHILFKLGYSHVINYTLPIQYEMQKKEKSQSFFKISGLGISNNSNILHKIKSLRYPNVYSKKGIFLKNELVQFKEGKKNFTL